MFSFAGVTYGFANPLLLSLGIPALAMLGFAYLRGGKGRQVIVSSVLLLQKLTKSQPARRKLIPPLRFFFELLVLAALTLTIGGFYREGFKQQVAIVIDNSYSSKIRLATNKTALDIHKEAAKIYINELPLGTGVDLFITSPNLKSITEGTDAKSSALSKIDAINSIYSSDKLSFALETLRSKDQFEQIAIFTDKRPTESSKANEQFVFKGNSLFADSFQNIAISDLSVSEQGAQNKVSAAIQLYGDKDTKVRLSIYYYESLKNPKLKTKGNETELKLKSLSSETYSALLPAALAYEIEVEPVVKQRELDSISDDDRAWIVAESRKEKILVVSNFSKEELGLNALAKFELDLVKPNEYKPSLFKDYSFVIFHKTVPGVFPEISSLFIQPNADSELFTISPPIKLDGDDFIEATNWSELHPVNSYLNVPALKLRNVVPLVPHSYAKSIINSEVGSLVLAGEINKRHYVATGFDIFPYLGKRSPLLSVLTINSFKWLLSSELSKGYSNANSEESKLGLSLIERDGARAFSATNFFDASELDTFSKQEFSIPAPIELSKQSESHTSKIVFYLVIGLLTILLLDLLAYLKAYLLFLPKRRKA
ncbi:MAG: BatA domain-containing protein [Deltaproteobacteria bacterium]|nr:BatA domain-containing protein [Deltaproteobacteria bacterium]